MLASEFADRIRAHLNETGSVKARISNNGGATSHEAFERFKKYRDFPAAVGILCTYLQTIGAHIDHPGNLAVSALPQRGSARMGFVLSAGIEEQLYTQFNPDSTLALWQISLAPADSLSLDLAEQDVGAYWGPYKSQPIVVQGATLDSFDKLIASPTVQDALIAQYEYVRTELHYTKPRADWHNRFLWEYAHQWLRPQEMVSRPLAPNDFDQYLKHQTTHRDATHASQHWLDRNADELNDDYFDVTEQLRENPEIVKSRPAQGIFRDSLLATRHRCQVCGITNPIVLEAAHIIPKALDGRDSSDNGLLLCRNHHRAFDEGILLFHHETNQFTWEDGIEPF